MTPTPRSKPTKPTKPITFPFRFSRAFRIAEMPFGITERNSMITVTEDMFGVRFGSWRVATRRANIRAVSVTGPYHFAKVAGPPRLSLSDRGLTFATNADRGVCIEFHEPIPGIEPTGRLRHPNLTVTPADCEGLAHLLAQSV